VGSEADLPPCDAVEVVDGGGGWLTPGLVDCHTHLVWAGSRSVEFEMRLAGVPYAEIARRGGGIRSTMRATRQASEGALLSTAGRRLQALMADGVTTIELKSGYGLDAAAEERILRVSRALGSRFPVSVVTTFLGAHAVPPEFDGRADDYVTEVVEGMLPALHRGGLVDAVDVFCEEVAFSVEQAERIFQAAAALGIPVKAHAEQLSLQGGAELVARYQGLSADHLEYLDGAGVRALAEAGSVAVLLPGAFHTLREERRPPVEALREAGVPMAVATDANPGTSPLLSLRLAMNLAALRFGLSPAEALAGATREGARALGLADRGALVPGLRADLVLWEVEHPAELVAQMGGWPLARRWVEGRDATVGRAGG
jgi:imidazolonepropionase